MKFGHNVNIIILRIACVGCIQVTQQRFLTVFISKVRLFPTFTLNNVGIWKLEYIFALVECETCLFMFLEKNISRGLPLENNFFLQHKIYLRVLPLTIQCFLFLVRSAVHSCTGHIDYRTKRELLVYEFWKKVASPFLKNKYFKATINRKQQVFLVLPAVANYTIHTD